MLTHEQIQEVRAAVDRIVACKMSALGPDGRDIARLLIAAPSLIEMAEVAAREPQQADARMQTVPNVHAAAGGATVRGYCGDSSPE